MGVILTNMLPQARTRSATDSFFPIAGKDRQVMSASEYLQKRRTYTGLEAPIVGAARKPIVKAVQGQTGRAAQYEHEPSGS